MQSYFTYQACRIKKEITKSSLESPCIGHYLPCMEIAHNCPDHNLSPSLFISDTY